MNGSDSLRLRQGTLVDHNFCGLKSCNTLLENWPPETERRGVVGKGGLNVIMGNIELRGTKKDIVEGFVPINDSD